MTIGVATSLGCRRALAALAFGACALAPVLPALSQAPGEAIERPEGAKRVVRVFDFEERDVNLEPIPMNWFRAVDSAGRSRPGYPRWNECGFDATIAYSGAHSVKLPTRGGSASLRLATGVVPALPGADYVIAAKVRTEGAVHARAQLTARFLGDQHTPIPGAESRGELIKTDGRWAETSVELSGDVENAAWIQIDLELLQPEHYRAVREEREVLLEDFDAAAWFDDVIIYQLPRVALRTDSPANVVVAPETPNLVAIVQDLTGERLVGELTVRDIDGAQVARNVFEIEHGARPAAWRPDLPAFGWYRARLIVSNETQVVSRRSVDFVWAPARARALGPERLRFGVIAEDLPANQRIDLPELLMRIGSGAIHLSAWSPTPASPDGRTHPGSVEAMMDALLEAGQSVTVTLGRPTGDTSADPIIADQGAFELLTRQAQDFTANFDHVVTKYGQRVRKWQIGETGSDLAIWIRGVGEGVDRVRDALARLAPEPRIALPWNAAHFVDAEIAERAALTMQLPHHIRPEGVEHYTSLWPANAEITLVVESPPVALYGARAAVDELVKRVVSAWGANPAAVAIMRPWSGGDTTPPQILPTPELAVFRQLVDRLSGRRIIAGVPAPVGVVALAVEGPDSDALIAWNDYAEPEAAYLHAYLADGPVLVIDPFGNTKIIDLVDGVHHVPLTQTPVFIEGVDSDLARFRSGVRIEPDFIASTAEKHEMTMVVENPWPQTITGRLRIVSPESWRISPRVLTFIIDGGETARLPFDASFGVGEEAGELTFQVDVDLAADRRYPTVRLDPKIEIGLPYVQLSPSFRIGREGVGRQDDLTVTLVITNTGSTPLTMQAYAMAPGFAREQAPVSNLMPSQSTVKRFIFRDGGLKLRGSQVRVGLIETDGLGRINKSLRIE